MSGPRLVLAALFALLVLAVRSSASLSGASAAEADLAASVGQFADVASSAYAYRADRPPEENPPESWIGLLQYAGLPFDRQVDPSAPAIRKVLCLLLWEEVRPIRRVELEWSPGAAAQPAPDELLVECFDGTDGTAHTWWNPRSLKDAGRPEVSADGRTYAYAIPVDTWGVVVSLRGEKEAATFAVPVVRALVPDRWKELAIEVEWGFDAETEALRYDGRIEGYDAIVGEVRPLPGDAGTTMTGPRSWRSERRGEGRRGLRLNALYIGSSRRRQVWPYHSQPEDVARSILTVWTQWGSFSFQVSDLELGPILAPEHGFFVQALPPSGQPRAAREFQKELAARNLKTTRFRARERPEQTWEGAVTAIRPLEALPPHPKPPFEPAMRIEVPCERLTAQWNLGAWHILRRSSKGPDGKWRFNDYPFGILASETYMILRALDLQGMHKEAADGFEQWLELPMEPRVVPGAGGHHEWARPDRPLGHFSDGRGCFTHAEGIPGVGGHMDGVHCMGPGAILYALVEHFRLTGDIEWLKRHAPRMKACAEWILRQRKLLAEILPGGSRLWSKGLQPAHVVTPDSMCMHMQFYESEAYYWLGVRNFAEALARIDPDGGAALLSEAAAYREDLLAAIDRSVVLSPVVAVRDGTYRSFIPFAPYVRGFASGAWGWRRCQGHVGAIYWDTVQSANPLVSPAGLLSPRDRRVQGHLDVLEDRLLLENTKIRERVPGFDPERDWFSLASWQYQCGLERHANIHLEADDPPNFLRSMLNQYAVDIMPGEYTFREHTTGGPPDKIYEEACFLERLRWMLVFEAGDSLWLARAVPRAWLEQGKRISVQDAPTHFGPISYEIVSEVDRGRIEATVHMPSRERPAAVLLRLRHPKALPISSVTVGGLPWTDFDREAEIVRLGNAPGVRSIEVRY